MTSYANDKDQVGKRQETSGKPQKAEKETAPRPHLKTFGGAGWWARAWVGGGAPFCYHERSSKSEGIPVVFSTSSSNTWEM